MESFSKVAFGSGVLLGVLAVLGTWVLARRIRPVDLHFDELLNQAPETLAVVVKDRDGHYLWANKVACKALGVRSPKELSSVPRERPVVNQEALDLDKQVIASERHVLCEIEHEGRTYATTKFPLTGGDIAGMYLDITQQRLLEQEVETHRRLESLGELSGGVAHDFFHILGLIRNYLNFIIRDIEDSDTLTEDVQTVMTALDQGENLATQLTAFARQESGEPIPVNLNETVENVKSLFNFPSTEVEIDLHEPLPEVLIDKDHAEQIVVNLALNARDAIDHDEGHIVISTYTEEGKVCLCVEDDGVGMSAEARDRCFEPFFTTKPRGEGTGLGLSQVYGIVTKLGGEIRVESTPGEGTKFTLVFPRADLRVRRISHAAAVDH